MNSNETRTCKKHFSTLVSIFNETESTLCGISPSNGKCIPVTILTCFHRKFKIFLYEAEIL